MKQETLHKLENFLVSASEQAISSGMEIVCGRYHPTDKSCDPIYAACNEDRKKAAVFLDRAVPQYEEIITSHIGEEFSLFHLQSFLNGFDTDKSIVAFYPDPDEKIFNLGRRLRRRYIVPTGAGEWAGAYSSEHCLEPQQLEWLLSKKEMPSKIVSHVNSCVGCAAKLSAPPVVPDRSTHAELLSWEKEQRHSFVQNCLFLLHRMRTRFLSFGRKGHD